MKMLKVDEFTKLISYVDADNDQLEAYIKDFGLQFEKIKSSFSGNDLNFLTNKNDDLLNNLKKIVKSNNNYYSNLRKVKKSYQEQNQQIVRDLRSISAVNKGGN